MKPQTIPYTVDDLHSTIDYETLFRLQANSFSQVIPPERSRQKTYCNPTHSPNQRYYRDRESSGINPKNK